MPHEACHAPPQELSASCGPLSTSAAADIDRADPSHLLHGHDASRPRYSGFDAQQQSDRSCCQKKLGRVTKGCLQACASGVVKYCSTAPPIATLATICGILRPLLVEPVLISKVWQAEIPTTATHEAHTYVYCQRKPT